MKMQKCVYKVMWEQSDGAMDFADTCLISPLLKMREFCSFVDDNVFYFYHKGEGECYYCIEDMNKASIAGLTDYSDESFTRNYFIDSLKAIQLVEGFIVTIENCKLDKITDEELIHFAKKSYDIIIELLTYFTACQPQCTSSIERKLAEQISNVVNVQDVNRILLAITMPTNLSKLNSEELDWLLIVMDAVKEKQELSLVNYSIFQNNLPDTLIAKITFHSKKYHLLGATDGSNDWNFEYYTRLLYNDIINFDGDAIEERIKSITNYENEVTLSIAKIYSEYRFSDQTIYLAKTLSKLADRRMSLRISGWMPIYYLLKRKILPEIARRKGIELNIIRSMRYVEFIDFIKNNNINRIELNKRTGYFLYGLIEGKIVIYSGDDALNMKNKLVEDVDYTGIKRITGTTAMGGKSSGPVMVFHWADNNLHKKMDSMNKGDILVAGQTRPVLMPAIRKASAIVVNEGGIASHAAIVSRELRIPCIVGTDIATKVFTDDDNIFVNADEGYAEKVRKANNDLLISGDKDNHESLEFREKQKITNGPNDALCLRLSNVTNSDKSICGPKGFTLGIVYENFNVPDGFIITTNVYRYFLHENNLYGRIKEALKVIKYSDPESVYRASCNITNIIENGIISKSLMEVISSYFEKLSGNVAVRSSAVNEDLTDSSFAGQMDTFLSIRGQKELFTSIKKCWASIFSERCLTYIQAKDIHVEFPEIAVIVQNMVEAKYSGVGFSISPTDQSKQTALIEIVRGLGEKLVSGEVKPNSYVISRKIFRIISSIELQQIDLPLLKSYYNLLISTEKYFKFPVDIEFASDTNNRLWLLQSRPITT